MSSDPGGLPLADFEPERETFLREVLHGLRQPRKQLPCKYFYDEAGSALFERICELEEYYPTRTELRIMKESAADMADAIGEGCLLLEYGSGSSAKTRRLLDELGKPAAYVPVDISREHLLASAAKTGRLYPELEVLPVCADFTKPFDVPEPSREATRSVAYFPGSTIGNFSREHATGLLCDMAERVAPDGGCLVGADLVKDSDVLIRAYDDTEGVTAAFNRNLLVRANRELGADFDLDHFRHEARWNDVELRIEMHLVSTREQQLKIGAESFAFEPGESICTEHSHKYTLKGFADMARDAGLSVARVWTDPRSWFSVQLLRVA